MGCWPCPLLLALPSALPPFLPSVGASSNVPDAHLSPPRLTLTNDSHSLAISWESSAARPPRHFWLRLSLSREPAAPELHVTKQAADDAHELRWADLPSDATSCFQLGVAENASAPPLYSEKACYAGCRGGRLGDAPAGAPDGGGGGCASCAAVGAVVGAACALACVGVCSALGWWQLLMTHAGAGGGRGRKYAHLNTNEMGAAGGGIELEPQEMPLAPPHGMPCAPRSAHQPPRAPRDVAQSVLEPHPQLEAAQFEQQWAMSANCTRSFTGLLPSPSPSAADQAEESLTHGGLTCIAAGAIGKVHKLYFAALLRGSCEWFMLELVLHSDTATAHCTFRSTAAEWISPLADHYAELLGQVLRTSLHAVR
ncbi:hypothetical protein AB1Y20_016622 [Prymnesium parvum]|uniref:Beta-adaptin appendage C-terminal subdomain domain-containing protein n=1 Tax=Prymnesium parvum TaxID=97485 RepID=A0AB34IAI9_PRYPA